MSLQEKFEMLYEQQKQAKQKTIVMQGVALTKGEFSKLNKNIIVR